MSHVRYISDEDIKRKQRSLMGLWMVIGIIGTIVLLIKL